MGRFKKREHRFPEEIEFLGLAEVLARSHPRHRAISGIYFLIDGTEVVYVGQSRNLPLRIHQHRLKGETQFDRFTVYPCATSLLDRLEEHYILTFQPRYNGPTRRGARTLSGNEAREAHLIQQALETG